MLWLPLLLLAEAQPDISQELLHSSNPLIALLVLVFGSLHSIDKIAFWMNKRRKNGNGNGDYTQVLEFQKATTHTIKDIAKTIDSMSAELQEIREHLAILRDRSAKRS